MGMEQLAHFKSVSASHSNLIDSFREMTTLTSISGKDEITVILHFKIDVIFFVRDNFIFLFKGLLRHSRDVPIVNVDSLTIIVVASFLKQTCKISSIAYC
jgi:hypothetical protein